MDNYINKEGSLAFRIVKGGFWSFALRGALLLLDAIETLFVVRILLPEELGLFGIVLIITSLMDVIIQSGFCKAVIQRQDDISKYLDTIWTVQIIRGFVIFFVLYSSAPFISSFFGITVITSLIRVFAFSRIMIGFLNVGFVYYMKAIDMKKQFIFMVTPKFVGLIITIVLVSIFKNVWGLAYGTILGFLFWVIFSFINHPFRPKLDLNISKIKELINYSRWMVGSRILNLLLDKGDRFIVGKWLGVASLGFYQISCKLSVVAYAEMSAGISQIMFPVYSEIQNDKKKLSRVYFNVLRTTIYFLSPLCGILLVFTPDFVNIFLGNNWMPVVMLLQILIVYSFIKTIGELSYPFFEGTGCPDLVTKAQTSRLIFLILIIFPLIKECHIIGVAFAVLLSAMFESIVVNLIVLKRLKVSLYEFLHDISFPILNTTLAGLLSLFIRYLLFDGFLKFIDFIFIVIMFVAFYGLVTWGTGRLLHYDNPLKEIFVHSRKER